MAKSGTAFTAADTINYGYDDKSQGKESGLDQFE